MSKIKDFLFGREYFYKDSKLGDFKTRTKSKDLNKNCTWTGDISICNQELNTVILIEGNFESPLKEHLETVHSIVDSYDVIVKKIEEEWKISERKNGPFDEKWLTKFYLSAIIPNDVEYSIFEINFEPKDNKSTTNISIVWENSKMSDFNILK